MKKDIENLSEWIENREMRGYYTFTKEDIEKQFPSLGKDYMKTYLSRLVTKAKIISPWRNFYVIMPIEYSLKGIIPPVFYMDQLMAYLDKKYYVALLNAAAFYGASHQRAQTFSVAVELPYMRSTSKNGTSILFFSKKEIQTEFIRKHKTQTGYINVSSPELTAIDLIENEKSVGGLNRVCTVLNELVDVVNLDSLNDSFFKASSTPVFQRLGYIMEHILRTNTVSKKYTNYYAVDKVSISIKKGEIYGLIGENGAGKSTLMKMIAGLVEPSEGSIELFGNFVPQTERYRIGCVIESPALYAELTAKQNLEVFRKAYGLSSKESVQQILKQVGLSQYENKIVKKFSLGMKQRLAIGIALLGNPDFLILDEPINGLDPTGIQDMRNFLLKLNREEHITIMISSHILGELSKIATKYGIIKNGKLNEEITAKELNEKCQCCLKIKASDTAQAAILIEKNLHTKNYEILSDNNIRIFEYVDNPGIVNSLLVNHGISVDECTVTKESLEDYFNEKMRGGIVNA